MGVVNWVRVRRELSEMLQDMGEEEDIVNWYRGEQREVIQGAG